jgi:hypothetical protein
VIELLQMHFKNKFTDTKKKRKAFSLTVMIVALLTGGCLPDPVTQDLVVYINQGLLDIAELEIKAMEWYGSINRDERSKEQPGYKILKNDVIPTYGLFLKLLRELNPKTKEVQSLHAIYLRGAEMICRGLKGRLLGIESKDENIIRQSDQRIIQGQLETLRWRDALENLSKAYGVDLAE